MPKAPAKQIQIEEHERFFHLYLESFYLGLTSQTKMIRHEKSKEQFTKWKETLRSTKTSTTQAKRKKKARVS